MLVNLRDFGFDPREVIETTDVLRIFVQRDNLCIELKSSEVMLMTTPKSEEFIDDELKDLQIFINEKNGFEVEYEGRQVDCE